MGGWCKAVRVWKGGGTDKEGVKGREVVIEIIFGSVQFLDIKIGFDIFY